MHTHKHTPARAFPRTFPRAFPRTFPRKRKHARTPLHGQRQRLLRHRSCARVQWWDGRMGGTATDPRPNQPRTQTNNRTDPSVSCAPRAPRTHARTHRVRWLTTQPSAVARYALRLTPSSCQVSTMRVAAASSPGESTMSNRCTDCAATRMERVCRRKPPKMSAEAVGLRRMARRAAACPLSRSHGLRATGKGAWRIGRVTGSHLRRDSPTSAPGLAHICAGTSRQLFDLDGCVCVGECLGGGGGGGGRACGYEGGDESKERERAECLA